MRQYKDSGIEWIGKIPDTWDIKRLKEIFVERNNRDAKGKTLLSVSQYYGIKPKAETDIADSHVAESYDDYKVVEKGDFVMNIMLAWNGSYAVSDYEGIVSPAYCVYQFRKDCCHKYLHYLLRTDGYQTAFKTMSRGIIDSRLRLYPEQFYTFNTIFPPVSEQQRIADYLDEKCGEVDSLIALQEQMIEKLKAYKQSVITEAVTKGLDHNAKLVSSGIDWIGEIPEAWSKDKVIRCFSIIGSGTTPKSTDDNLFKGDINWLQSGDINGGDLFEASKHISKETLSSYSALSVYQAPFIIIAMYGASVGNISISHIDACVNQACCVMSGCKLDFNYAFYALKSAKPYLIYRAEGGGQPNISQDKIKTLWIPIPPLTEQQGIASYLDEKCADIDRLIALKQLKIESLKNYKKSVIYEAVTGKTIIE
jgi:type I restriction enzyme S subunit